MTRHVLFRDGSILRLPVLDEKLKITLLRAEGGLAEMEMPLSALKALTLTQDDGFAKKRALLAAVRQLGSEDFNEREKAFNELLKLGAEHRSDLETCLRFTADFEAQTRLKSILSKLPPSSSKNPGQVLFDFVQLKEPHWGHLGETAIAVVVAGKVHRLTRRDIVGLSTFGPGGAPGGAPVGAPASFSGPMGFHRIRPGDFPPGCVEEPFEKTPDGRFLNIGDNIEKIFLSKGLVLSTSIATSYVSVNGFAVQGKSLGMSVATHQPLWEGEITVRFVQPGREEVPAGVSHFGCYIAAVVPGGTAMIGYDLHGRELGRIETKDNGHEFLGVSSSTPMHRIRFVPNLKLDRDYTLDDFIFSPPQSPEARHAEKFGVTLSEGDRIFCRDVVLDKELVHLEGMPGGLPNRSVRLAEVRRLNWPEGRPGKGRPGEGVPPGVFAELRDGSILFGGQSPADKKAPKFGLPVHPFQKPQDLVGLWGSTFSRLAQAPQPGQAVRWDAWEKKWLSISAIRFSDVEAHWKGHEGPRSLPYHQLGPLWLVDPPRSQPAGWHLVTRNGDDLVLAQADQLSGRLSRELHAAWQGHKLRLSPKEASALFQVARSAKKER